MLYFISGEVLEKPRVDNRKIAFEIGKQKTEAHNHNFQLQ